MTVQLRVQIEFNAASEFGRRATHEKERAKTPQENGMHLQHDANEQRLP